MTKLIATLCFYLQLHRLAYFLNRNRKRVITFHNVLTDDVFDNNIANGVSCSFSQFKAIIEEISKYFPFSLDLDDAKTATITFDDGYQNQVVVAAPYLLSKGIPAYLFVSGQLLQQDGVCEEKGRNVLVIDLLLHWVAYAPNGSYECELNGKYVCIELSDCNRYQIWGSIVWPAYVECTSSKGENILNALDSVYPILSILSALSRKYVEQRLSGIRKEQLQRLVDNGWEIGWHTYSHFPLSKLPYEEKCKELKPDVDIKSKVLSYPYGGICEVDSECLTIAKQIGYTAAVSNINIPSSLSEKWFRARISVSSNKMMLHFELSGLKYLIKYHKLLPKI